MYSNQSFCRNDTRKYIIPTACHGIVEKLVITKQIPSFSRLILNIRTRIMSIEPVIRGGKLFSVTKVALVKRTRWVVVKVIRMTI